ncbi:MAG TPA: carboxypeptidase regulatory-like domain-containing protein, partial [Vicinamibacterales bacterium]
LGGTARNTTTDERGRFTIDSVFAGNYTLDVHTASLDSMNAAHRVQVTLVDSTTPLELKVPTGVALAALVCGGRVPASGAIIVGTLRLRDAPSTAALRGGKVVAEWSADPLDTASSRARRLEAPAAQDGSFRVCGVPMNASISLSATTDSAETAEPITVHIPAAARITRTEVMLDREAALALRGATFSGVVVTDSTKLPIAGVEVSFPELGKSVFTDGQGAFRIFGIPPGEQHLMVRRIGYGAADTRVTFAGHETLERRVVLGRAVRLDPVVVAAKENDRTMPGFEENRRVGLGHFLTRDSLAKYEGMKLATALQQMQGFGMVDGRGHQWPSSRYVTPPLCPSTPQSVYAACMQSHGFYVPENHELAQGMRTACYAQVYVDGVLMNGMREPIEPFDIAPFTPERLEAIEYYAGPSQTPLKYSRMGSACGVLVIWTRRSR